MTKKEKEQFLHQVETASYDFTFDIARTLAWHNPHILMLAFYCKEDFRKKGKPITADELKDVRHDLKYIEWHTIVQEILEDTDSEFRFSNQVMGKEEET